MAKTFTSRTNSKGLEYGGSAHDYYWNEKNNIEATIAAGLADCTTYSRGRAMEMGLPCPMNQKGDASTWHTKLINGWTAIKFDKAHVEPGDIVEWGTPNNHVASVEDIIDGVIYVSASWYTGSHGKAYIDGKYDKRTDITSLKELSDLMFSKYSYRTFHYVTLETENSGVANGAYPTYILKQPSSKKEEPMGQFTKRTKKPTSANKEYIRTANGGWSTCCKGSPLDSQCTVLSNCVGYACGRFNEIYNEIMGTTGMKYPALNCNAENFIERAQQYYPDIKLSKDPKPGAIICWSKGKVGVGDDGAGHVGIVEEVVDNDTIITSESAYGGTAWYSKTRKRGSDGNWGLSSPYAFRYFMLNPAVNDNMPTPVSQNIGVNQIEVTVSGSVNVRIDPNLKADIVGLASKGFYNVLDTKEADGYLWYHLGHDQWIAQVDVIKYHEAYEWKMPISVAKDTNKNQVYVGEVCVHIRMNAGTAYTSMGYLDHSNAYFDVLEVFKGTSYTWYKLAPYSWIAGVTNVKYYPAQSTPTPTPDPQDEFDIYVVVKGDTLSKIASKFNTTVKYLAEINNITNVNVIEIGQKLKVPKQSKPTPTPEPEPVEDKIFGIDISEWQDDINMDKVAAEGVKFAILRAGFTGSSDGISKGLDASFEKFYKQCKEHNIKVGAYWFSRATSYEAGAAEAKFMIDNCLKGKQFEYPIAIDVEDDKYQISAGKEAVTQAIIGFCDTLKANHYYPALYININWLKNYVNKDKLADIPKWIAYWGTEKPADWNPEIWQFGGETNLIRTNKIAGLVVDQDYSFVDYDKNIVEAGLNGFGENEIEIPKEDETPIENPEDNKSEEKEPEPNTPEPEKPEEQDTPSKEQELTNEIDKLNNTIISLKEEIEQNKKTITSIKKHITSIDKLLKD